MALALRSPSLASKRPSVAGRGQRATPVSRRVVSVRAGQTYPSDWLKKDPLVFGAAFLGWTIPSNIPVSGFGGKSLFGLLTDSIGSELAHFPTGPSLDDSFWLYLITWHVGLFVALTLGQIGVQARKQGYW